MKIADDVYKIKGDSNVYLVLKPTPTIIDTSDAIDRFYIKREIEKIIPISNIEKVILTHLHYDHIGNVELFENAKFYASREEIEDYRRNPKDFFLYNISSSCDSVLRDKLINIPNKINNLKVIKCPGHTRGSIALIDEKRKILFSGDTLFRDGTGRADLPNSVPLKMKKSVDTLKNYLKEGYLLCPGHDY